MSSVSPTYLTITQNQIKPSEVNYQEIGIALTVGIVIIICSYFGSNWLIFDDRAEAEAKLTAKVEKLQIENKSLEVVKENFTKLTLESSKAQEEYKTLQSLIPEESELTKILNWLADDAKGRNIRLEHFAQDKGVKKAGDLTEISITIGVYGDIDQIGRFTDDIARYQRLLKVENIKIQETVTPATQQPDGTTQTKNTKTLDYNFTKAIISVNAYVGKKAQIQ